MPFFQLLNDQIWLILIIMSVNGKNVVIVLGMHRSGTSLVTRGVATFGAELGTNLVSPAFDNPMGFWEDKTFVSINNRVLEAIGQSYESMAIIPGNLNHDKRTGEIRQEAAELIKEKISESSLWVVKDPRTSRLLSFWKPIFDEYELTVEYVIAVRHPLSVAESLKTRNDFPIMKSLLLWLEHYVACVSETRLERRVFVDYDMLIDNPYKELERLGSMLGMLDGNRANLSIESFVSGYISDELRHTRYTRNDLLQTPGILADLSSAYELLQDVSQDKISATNADFITQWAGIAARLEDFAPVLNFLYQRDYEAIVKNIELVGLRDQMAVLKSELATNQQVATEQKSQIANLSTAVSKMESRIADLNRKLKENQSLATSLEQEVAKRDAQVARHRQALTDREAEVRKRCRKYYTKRTAL